MTKDLFPEGHKKKNIERSSIKDQTLENQNNNNYNREHGSLLIKTNALAWIRKISMEPQACIFPQ